MKSSKKFRCHECLTNGSPREFSRASLFRQHQLKVHAEKSLKCSHCPKTFSVSYLLKQHENQCNLTVNCDRCGAKFKHRSSLQRHLKVVKHGEPSNQQTKVDAVVLNIMAVQLLPVILVSNDATSTTASVAESKPVASATKARQTYRPIRRRRPPTPNVSAPKESTSAQTSTELPLAPGSSIATQTVMKQCNVAVGIDEVLDDLEKLFAQAETQTQCQSYEQNFQHAETQTYHPSFANSDMQSKFDKLNDFLPLASDSLPSADQVERILDSVEVRTSFEPQMQNFGMQTMFPQDSKIAGTQTLSVSSFDGHSQTGMELSSVETQTIEQFLNALQNAS